MNTITVRGMILSSMPIGEYDRRLEILTDSLGRISAFARGARKPSSALVSATRVFAFGEFDLYEGRSSYNINAARITNYFEDLSKDVNRTYYGFYFLEFCSYFTREGLDATGTLKLLYQSLRALSVPSLDNSLVKGVFELKMLEINGICPPAAVLASRENLSQSAAYAVDFVKRTPVEKLYTFTLSEKVLKEFLSLVDGLVKRSVDKKFKSLEMIGDFPADF
ncbi:MAG: DNA repair protein RecO [Parasporobacterium sp.]|nr:DNA repair protein RecO [Parasporobacterium sp.]